MNENKQICVLTVDVQLQPNGKFDVYVGEDGSSGWHKTDMTIDEIGREVADQILCYTEAIDQ